MKKNSTRGLLTEILCGAAVLLALCGAGGTPPDASEPPGGMSEQEKQTAGNRIFSTGPFFVDDKDAKHPEKEIVRDGIIYRLVSETLEETVQEGILTYVSSDVTYELEGEQEPPDTASITLTDESSGKTYERQLPRLEVKEQNSRWEGGFSFEITVTGYDADTFLLGETEIPADVPLETYEEEFLKELGLPVDCYRIDSVEWLGEAYSKNGAVCRNALAMGQKLVRQTIVKYGGQIRTPEITGKQYVGIYEAWEIGTEETEVRMPEEKTGEERIRAIEEKDPEKEPEKEPESEGLRLWIREHVTVVTVSLFVAAGVIAALWLCLTAGKRKEH